MCNKWVHLLVKRIFVFWKCMDNNKNYWNLFVNKFMPIHVWCSKWPEQKVSLLQWVLYDRDFTGYGKLIWVSNISLCFISLPLMLRLRPTNLLDLSYNLKLFTLLFLSFIQIYFGGMCCGCSLKTWLLILFTYCVILFMTPC
jgi:hypothetical protein